MTNLYVFVIQTIKFTNLFDLHKQNLSFAFYFFDRLKIAVSLPL